MAKRLIYPGLLVITLLGGMTGALGAPLVPMIAEEEQVSLGLAQWSLTASLLVGAVTAPLVGRLGVGRRLRPVLIVTLLLAALGALLSALPLGIASILAGRALQGLAYAVSPLLFTIARDVLPEERLGSSISTLSVANVVAAGLGFPVVSFVAEHAGLHGAFWFAVVLMVIAVATAAVVVPGSTEPAPARVDLVGAVLLGGGVLGVLLVISRADQWGLSPLLVGVLLGGLLLLGLSAVWLRRAAHPLVDLRLAGVPSVLGAHLAAVFAGCGMFLLMSLVMVIAQSGPPDGYGLGRSVAFAGLMMTPYAVASVVGNRFALRLGRVVDVSLVVPAGCVLYAVANLFLWRWHLEPWQLVVAMSLAGVASGMTFNALPWLLIRRIPVAETGSVLGVNVVVRFTGFALGSAVSLAVLSAFGGDAGTPTRQGFQAAVLVGAAICLLAAAVSWLLFRGGSDRPVESRPSEDPGAVLA